MTRIVRVVAAALLLTSAIVSLPHTAIADPVQPRIIAGCNLGASYSQSWTKCYAMGWPRYAATATCNSGADVFGPFKPMGSGILSYTSRCYSGVHSYAYILGS